MNYFGILKKTVKKDTFGAISIWLTAVALILNIFAQNWIMCGILFVITVINLLFFIDKYMIILRLEKESTFWKARKYNSTVIGTVEVRKK
jgi:phosphatidylglycerophosphatase A